MYEARWCQVQSVFAHRRGTKCRASVLATSVRRAAKKNCSSLARAGDPDVFTGLRDLSLMARLPVAGLGVIRPAARRCGAGLSPDGCSTHHHGSSSRGICSHGCVIGWGGLAVIREADHRHTRCQPSPIRVWKSVVLDRNSRLNEHWRRFLASSPRTPRRPVKRRNHQRRHSATRD